MVKTKAWAFEIKIGVAYNSGRNMATAHQISLLEFPVTAVECIWERIC